MKSLKKILFAATTCLWLTAPAPAQTTFSSVEELWKYADAHNVAIINALRETRKAEHGVTQSYLAFAPTLNANAGYTDNTTIQTTLIPAVIFGGPDNTYRPVQFGQKYTYNAGFTAQLDLVNVQTWHNTRIARETAEVNKAAGINTKRNVYQQIAAQYYNCLLSHEGLKLAKQSAAVADSVLQSINNRFAAGLASQPGVDMAKINAERAQQTYITATYQHSTALNTLKGLLALPVADSINVTGNLTSGKTEAPAGNFTEDPAVRLQYHQVALNKSRLSQSNANAYPTLSVLYSNNTQQFDNTFRPLDASGPKWYPANFWSLRASWSILNGGNRWLQSQKNKLAYMQSQDELEQAKRQADINDENLRLSFARASALLENSRRIMLLAYDNYYHTTMRYDEGISSLEDRLRAFSDYISYQNQYLNSLSEMLVQHYNIKIRQQTL